MCKHEFVWYGTAVDTQRIIENIGCYTTYANPRSCRTCYLCGQIQEFINHRWRNVSGEGT